MKKVFKLEGDICPNCGGKIQDAINRLDGVNEAKINFLTLKFTLDAEDDRFDQLLGESKRIFEKIEPTCSIVA
ncbi:heavy-metal-associated domain-containing protein [Gordonibacter sp. Marseille-P4307]|uniref:heavy-metal-associated domain-containing protein n=1 Tax=Gordonibacter sp. Marseille-P4307 TaxID=2161815 RepID=UPI000F52D02E|nr:cation transporter [Gordonibacter sp. Marseille-P4307]